MTIIKCPECKKEISGAVAFCTYCGYPLKEKKENSDNIGENNFKEQVNSKLLGLKKGIEKNNKTLTILTAVLMIVVALFNVPYIFSHVIYLFDDLFDIFRYGLDVWVLVDFLYVVEFMALAVGFVITAIVLLTNKNNQSLKYTPFIIAAGYMSDAVAMLLMRLKYGMEFGDILLFILALSVAAIWIGVALVNRNEFLNNIHTDKRIILLCIALAIVLLEFIKLVFFANVNIINLILLMVEYALPALFIINNYNFNNNDNEVRITMDTTNNTHTQVNQSFENIEGYLKIWKLIVFSILTFGIYTYIWIYRTVGLFNGKKIGEEKSQGVQVVLCLFVPFYTIYWLYKQSKQTEEYTIKVGNSSNDLAVISLVLSILGFSLIAMALIQDQINKNLIAEYGDTTKTEYNIEQQKANQSSIVEGNKIVYAQAKEEEAQKSKIDRISDTDIEYLKKLKELKDMGILTEEEYAGKKESILKY